MDIRKKSLMIRAVRQSHRLPKKAVAAPSLQIPEVRGWGSEHLMELWVSMCIAGELHEIVIKSPFQLKRFCDDDDGWIS